MPFSLTAHPRSELWAPELEPFRPSAPYVDLAPLDAIDPATTPSATELNPLVKHSHRRRDFIAFTTQGEAKRPFETSIPQRTFAPMQWLMRQNNRNFNSCRVWSVNALHNRLSMLVSPRVVPISSNSYTRNFLARRPPSRCSSYGSTAEHNAKSGLITHYVFSVEGGDESGATKYSLLGGKFSPKTAADGTFRPAVQSTD